MDDGAEVDNSRMRDACKRALWNPAPTVKETEELTLELEGYVRTLGPPLAALVPRMSENMQPLAAVVLRHLDEVLDEVLDERAPRSDAAARLEDLGVVIRAALELLERPGELAPTAGSQMCEPRLRD
ncbi:hypothetical protein ABT052_39570 [Streptomyces sp. NPDC002766]|uniref:hypothetical protein n=1 Tax=unclassified Streptomyces TaxID=2593676 RepID=UPI0033331215